MAITYKPLVKPLPGSRSQRPMFQQEQAQQPTQLAAAPGMAFSPQWLPDVVQPQLTPAQGMGHSAEARSSGQSSPGAPMSPSALRPPGSSSGPVPMFPLPNGSMTAPQVTDPGRYAPAMPGAPQLGLGSQVQTPNGMRVPPQQLRPPGVQGQQMPWSSGPSLGAFKAPQLPQQVPPTPQPMPTPAPAYQPSSPQTRAQFGPDGRPVVAPGSGNVIYHDNEYNPDPATRQKDDAWLGRIMRNNPAGSGMNGAGTSEVGPGPYGSMGRSGLGRFDALQGERELRPRWEPGPGETYKPGHLDAADASRRVGQGRAAAYVDGGFRNATPAQQEAAANQRSKKEALRAGRNIRANERSGAPLRPDLYQSERAKGLYAANEQGSTSLNPTSDPVANYSPDNPPTGTAATRSAAIDQSLQAAIFRDSASKGFDGSTASFDQSLEFFDKEHKNWSDADKAEFRKYVISRADNDKEGFNREYQKWASRTEFPVPEGMEKQKWVEFERINAQRSALGLPPLRMTTHKQDFVPVPVGPG